jgi:sigma-B regulation protein RsbU (phosphoserine phosphatase)
MIDPQYILIALTSFYLIFLLLIAYIADRIYKTNRKLIYNPYVYSLSLAIYCSTWTFYGAIDRAATSGIDFITIYIGPTLIIFTWWFLMRKLIRISDAHSINSIAGFISFRYGKSKTLGAIATILLLISIIPYIALQLKAIGDSISIIVRQSTNVAIPIFFDITFTLTLLLGIIAALFAAYLNIEQRKHPALVGVIALQSLLILTITVSVGIFVTYHLYDGFADIFKTALNNSDVALREKIKTITRLPKYTGASFDWFAVNVMSMFAIILLPRMFHITVVENYDEKHISKAIFLFPLYMFFICLFVYPVAIAALLNNADFHFKSYYIFTPLFSSKNQYMIFLAYLGGLASGVGMILVSTISLANMVVNYIIIPLLLKIFLLRKRKLMVIHLRRLCIFAILILTYLYYYKLGNTLRLREMGLVSFSAISQFAPAFFLGLYWKNANAKGATVGILSGFAVWAYTVIIPHFANHGILPEYILTIGPFHIELLKPTALLGLSNLGFWGHSFFWSILINTFSLMSVSLFTRQSTTEKETSKICTSTLEIGQIIDTIRTPGALTLIDYEEILSNFFGENYAKEKIGEYLKTLNKDREMLNAYDLTLLKTSMEKTLSEAVGPAASKLILDTYIDIKGIKEVRVINVFRDLVSLGIGESKDTLIRRISELNVMLGISTIFFEIGNLQKKTHKVLNLIKDTFKIDSVILREMKDNGLTILSYTGDIKESSIIGFKRQIDEESYIGKCAINKTQYAINDIDLAKLNDYSIELKNSGVISFCHTPLIINDELIGILSVYSKIYKGLFTDEFLMILQSIANQMAFYINSIKQTEDLIRMREISKELDIAKNIQKSLLPSKYPSISNIDLSALCLPSEFVGGDYYDFYSTNHGCLDILIADVSGHNVASALIMAEVRTLIKSIITYRSDAKPSEILTLVNSIIYPDLEQLGFIITLFYLRINFNTKELIYANAGHNGPLLLRNDMVLTLKEGDLLLGAIKDYKYSDFKLPLFAGDTLLLYTDGLTEAENDTGELFGEDRLTNHLHKCQGEFAKNIQESILNEIIKFRGLKKQKDDITMVIAKFKGH